MVEKPTPLYKWEMCGDEDQIVHELFLVLLMGTSFLTGTVQVVWYFSFVKIPTTSCEAPSIRFSPELARFRIRDSGNMAPLSTQSKKRDAGPAFYFVCTYSCHFSNIWTAYRTYQYD